jgi:hypothetical protein
VPENLLIAQVMGLGVLDRTINYKAGLHLLFDGRKENSLSWLIS